jgi:hypothetical protein
VEWSFDGPLLNLWPVIPISNQDGRQAKNRKQRGWNLKKIFSSETALPNKPKFGRMHLWEILYKDCSFRPDPLTNIDASYQVSVHLAKWFQRRRI